MVLMLPLVLRQEAPPGGFEVVADLTGVGISNTGGSSQFDMTQCYIKHEQLKQL